MSLSKETEVIFDEHRGVDYDSKTHHFMTLQHFIKRCLVAMQNLIMPEAAIQTANFLKRN